MVRSQRPGLSFVQPAPSALTGLLASGSSSPIDSISIINEGSVRERTTNPTRETDSLITLRDMFSPPGLGGRETPHVGAVLGNDQGIPKDQVFSRDRAEEETRELTEGERGVEIGSRAATSTVTGAAKEAPESEDGSASEDSSRSGDSPSPARQSWICVEAPNSPTELSGDAVPAGSVAAASKPEVPGPGAPPAEVAPQDAGPFGGADCMQQNGISVEGEPGRDTQGRA